jgi:hypothetical protein
MKIYHEYNPAYNDIQKTVEFILLYPDFVISERQPIWKQESGPRQQHRYKRYIVRSEIVISGVYYILIERMCVNPKWENNGNG